MKTLLLLVSFLTVASKSHGEEIGLFELVNYFEYSPHLASSGQPTRDQLQAISTAGIEAVINLSPVNETAAYADEGKLIDELGMYYAHIPVDWQTPSISDLEKFFEAMKQFREKRILVHCYLNARASAFVYLWRTHQAGHNEVQALATLVKIWSWNEGYELRNVDAWSSFVERARNKTWN
jgi:uncharacterized protein (TIGR01244 family)